MFDINDFGYTRDDDNSSQCTNLNYEVAALSEGFYNFSKVCCPTNFALKIVSTVIITSIQLN